MNTALPHLDSPRISLRLALVLFLAVLALAVPQAALLPLLDRDEPRFAEASCEMLQSGNYIVPMFNHAPRYAKPPLIYWCQAAAFAVIGENAFAARLPSLLATAATAVVLLTWGTRLGHTQAGLAAGLLYAFSFQTIQQGRVATADVLLIFFMTLTAFTGWLILRQKTPPMLCYLVLAVGHAGGFLAKGPEALLPFVPLLWCARKSGAKILAGLVLALLAALVLVLLWAIPAYLQTKGDYWRIGLSEGISQRMVTGLQGHGANSYFGYLIGIPLYYSLLFFVSALPWSPLLILHRKKLFAHWKLDTNDIYLLLNAALIFLVFSLMATKLPHYTLPAFPFLLLAFTRRWFALSLNPCRPVQLAWSTGFAFALAASVLVPLALANGLTPSPVGRLVRDAHETLTPTTEFAVVDFQEPNAIWEMRHVTTTYGKFIDESQVADFLAQSGPHAVIVSSPRWISLLEKSELKVETNKWKFFYAHGFNAAKLGPLDLTLIVKP